ncbi:hypothetical protein DUZ99_14465 [Xylanibacillus composti]|uniref:Apea-like HEPN domain-containing protein n=1 Tax=Xylanibacillus composti TaxID=1572762 RepID=A0A8J4H7J2_9BACL|nr:HEPN domain-containing protein [Xylanibacillus composti]MDT9726181.1 hypothetical protein [Xylanibacillus composti]GIQ71441.1 hypothetical protein XYCOK13_42650 [Xylanibacillus composti]
MKKFPVIGVLPYLKTTDTVVIRGVRFRSSSNISEVPPKYRDHLQNIFEMFYLRDNFKIKNMVYVFELFDSISERDEFIKALFEAQALITFMYSSPHPTLLDLFLSQEHVNTYLFFEKDIPYHSVYPPQDNLENLDKEIAPKGRKEASFSFIKGYEGILNNSINFWVTEGNRIYPPTPNFYLNIPQDLLRDFHSSELQSTNSSFVSFLNFGRSATEINDRIFNSLKWYNRSTSVYCGEEQALVYMAIAFESLLDLEHGDHVTKRFKEAVILLVGRVEKLESWLDQFYKARSEIVHEGQTNKTYFFADGKYSKRYTKYRSLVSYGRMIYRVCISTIMHGSEMVQKISLSSLFTTNRERFQKICMEFKEVHESPDIQLLSLKQVIKEIGIYRFVSEDAIETKLMLTSVKSTIKVFLATEPNIPKKYIQLMEDFIDCDSGQFNELTILKDLDEIIKQEEETLNISESHEIVFSLIKSVWSYTFMIYFKKTPNSLSQQEENNDIIG